MRPDPSAWNLASLALLTIGCGERTIERDCASVQLIPHHGRVLSQSGRTLDVVGGWKVGEIQPDGTHLDVVTLALDLDPSLQDVAFEHDPQTGRMWVMTWYEGPQPGPTWLVQFDATGQVEWSEDLGAVGIVRDASLLYQQGSLFLAMRVDDFDYAYSYEHPHLQVERRDGSGLVQWSRSDLLTPDGDGNFAGAELHGVVGDALALLATPPLTDYGPSYPLTLDVETGETLWLASERHSSIALAADEERLHIAWSESARIDPERYPPERVELEPARSVLRETSREGTILAEGAATWPEAFSRTTYGPHIQVAPLGEQIVSLVEGMSGIGITVHTREGERVCQDILPIPMLLGGVAQAIVGREQIIVPVVDYASLEDAYLLLTPPP